MISRSRARCLAGKKAVALHCAFCQSLARRLGVVSEGVETTRMYSSPALIPRESYIPSSFLSASSSSSPVEDDSSSRLQLRDRISIPQLSSFTHYRENRSLLSHLFSPQLCTSEGTGFTLFPTSPTNISGSLTYFSSLLCEKLDILSSLPSEISVEILLYLHPEDICRWIALKGNIWADLPILSYSLQCNLGV